MSKDSQRLADFLAHMLQAIERIVSYTEGLEEVASCKMNWSRTR